MSNRRNNSKKPSTKDTKKEKEVLAGDIEEEYNPDEVFEEEEEEGEYDIDLPDGEEEGEEDEQEDSKRDTKKEFDLTKISHKQRQVFERNNKKVLFLKALARNCYQDITKLGKMCGLYHRSESEGVISLMIGMIGETAKDVDYPAKILKAFNGLVPEGYPGKVYLEAHHINELTNLFYVLDDKLKSTAKIIDPDKIFGAGAITDAKTINPPDTQQDNIVMMDSSSQQENQQQQQQPTNAASNVVQTPNQPYQRVQTGSAIPVDSSQQYYHQHLQQVPPISEMDRDIEHFAAKYPAPDIGLMEMALRRIPNPRPNSIMPFINSFVDLYTDWMGNPMKMVEELKFFFGPTHGEHAYRLWKDYRERYMKQIGYAPLPSYGASTGEYSPYNFGGRYGGVGGSFDSGGGLQPMYMNPEVEEDRRWNRKMEKMMKMIEMKLMSETLEAQQQSPMMYGQNYEEILDPNSGKVIKRVFLGNGHSNGFGGGAGGMANPAELTMVSALSNIFNEMLRGANSEKVELLKKINTPDTTLSDFTRTIMSNYVNQQNPISQIKELMEISNLVKGQNPANAQEKSIEAIKLDVDSRIALQEIELKKLEMQHNWRMDERQQSEQDSNVDKWLNVMLQMGEGIIKPVAMKFVEGFGMGGKMSGLGGLFGGGGGQQQGQPQQPSQQMAQAQQYEAMRQQQMYNQQPQQQYQQQPQPQYPPQQQYQQPRPEPPLQPLPRGSNLNKPVGQLSDQDIQNELSRYTPQQLQEMEDKMALNAINQEKVLNAIRAQKNARRYTQPRPQPSYQQQEAQNVLNPSQQSDLSDEELEEELGGFDEGEEQEFTEDDFDEDDSSYIPVARGSPPAAVQQGQPIRTKQRKFSEFMPESTTETIRRKKLTNKQQAMLAEGQLSPRELRNAPDIDYDEGEEEDDYGGVPIAGVRNYSDDVKVEENLKRIENLPSEREEGHAHAHHNKKASKKKKEEKPQSELPKQQQQQEENNNNNNIVQEAEDLLDEAELIPSDDI